MPRVWNKRDPNVPPDAVYVGRPSKWGNPFVIGKDGSRDYVLGKYRNWLSSRLRDGLDLSPLRGKDLVCWCAPESCHADILMDFANSEEDASKT